MLVVIQELGTANLAAAVVALLSPRWWLALVREAGSNRRPVTTRRWTGWPLDAPAGLPEAEAFFHTFDRKNPYPICYRLKAAKPPETRARGMRQILYQLLRGERFR